MGIARFALITMMVATIATSTARGAQAGMSIVMTQGAAIGALGGVGIGVIKSVLKEGRIDTGSVHRLRKHALAGASCAYVYALGVYLIRLQMGLPVDW